MKKTKFDLLFEDIMSKTENNFFEQLVVKEIIEQIQNVILNEAEIKYVGGTTFEWKYNNGIGCQITISDNGQVFASAAREYPGDKEAFDNDDYQVFENHSVYIYSIQNFTSGDFKVLLEEMLDLAGDE